MDYTKYQRGYFPPPSPSFKWTQKEYIDHAPAWCSVDLRDGNQALVIPMGLEDKLEFFRLLLYIGFKEIEVGFPAASATEYDFLRRLIGDGLIPEDVTIQVLTQAREHIIKKTFDSLSGCKNAVVHLYNSTSAAQREQVFKMSRNEIKAMAVHGAELVAELGEKQGYNLRYEYSPESFTATEPQFALEVCNAVLDVWQPTPTKKAIINLPVTVELSMPHIYASQIEYMCDNLKYRDSVVVSIHPHNDRGCGVADSELGLLAGAQRVEGTLFGNGERTGNADIVTMAMNMYSHGVDPMLNFSDMPWICERYEHLTGMAIPDRQPYCGKLVFAAFSGSHQDAIAKGIKWRSENAGAAWNVPYLLIDPRDVGREYETDVIRINSQSGKGGIGYVMERYYGFELPKKLREDFGYVVKSVSDLQRREIPPQEIYTLFVETYVNQFRHICLVDYHFKRSGDAFAVTLTADTDGKRRQLSADGNGRLDAVSNALKKLTGVEYTLVAYNEHALDKGSTSRAVSYVGIDGGDGVTVWGAGVHDDIIASSIMGLFNAVNRLVYKSDSASGGLVF